MRSLVSLTFDDGLRCHFEDALPVLKRHEFLATFFLIADEKPTHEEPSKKWWKINWSAQDIAMLQDLVQQGHEIGSHSVTHDGRQLQSKPDFEVSESKRLIEGWLGSPISSFCYPFYRTDSFLEGPARRAGYKQARTGAGSRAYPLAAPLPFNVDCHQVSACDNPKDWIKPDSWYVLTFHGVGDQHSGWMPISVTEFSRMMRELASYRDSGAVEVVTFEEAAKRFRRFPH